MKTHASAAAPAPRPSGWTPVAVVGLLALMAVAAWSVWPTLAHIFEIASSDEEQSHVLLVPFVAGWLLWLRRGRVDLVPPRPSWLGPAVVAAGWALGTIGFTRGLQALEHLGAFLVLAGAVLALTGPAAVRHFAVLIPLLLFAVPVPGFIREQIAIPLQRMAAVVTHESLQLCGVASERTGNVLWVNGEQIAVAEACNGMRMVFALGLVVYAFVFSVPLRAFPRLFLVAMAPVIALVCNVIRLVPTSLFYGFGSQQSAETFHDLSGWLMLGVALFLVWQLVRLLEWLELPVNRLRLAGS